MKSDNPVSEDSLKLYLRREYWCFISYKHTDNQEDGRQWASWLHHHLETYEVPKDLVGKPNQDGKPIPDAIYPVFRDEDELGAGNNLSERIYRALDRSRTLIVLCSPRVMNSSYVDQEIRHFKKSGEQAEVYAAIIDGEPNARTINAQCFPPPLIRPVGENGEILEGPEEIPLAADFRLPEGTQGWTSAAAYREHLHQEGINGDEAKIKVQEYERRLELAKLKLISGILRVPLGILQERDKAYQLEQAANEAAKARRWVRRIGAVACVAIIAAFWALISRKQAIENFETARETADGLVTHIARDLRDVEGMRTESVKKILARAEETFGILLEKSPKNQDLLESSANMHNEFVTTYLVVGDTESAQRSAKASYAITQQLSAKGAKQLSLQSLSLMKLGDSQIEVGDHSEAEASYRHCLELRREALLLAPDDLKRMRDVAVALARLAEIGETRDDPDFSEPLIAESVSIRRTLAEQDPVHETTLLIGLMWHADIAILKKDTLLARRILLEAEDIVTRLVKDDPINKRHARNLAITHQRFGNMHLLETNYDDAVLRYQKSFNEFERLSYLDPGNRELKSDLSIGKMKIAEAHRQAGEKDLAILSYNDALERFMKINLDNDQVANWRSDLAETYYRLGNLEDSEEKRIDYFREAKAILIDLKIQGFIGKKHEGWLREIEVYLGS